jgi:hypothetical protein
MNKILVVLFVILFSSIAAIAQNKVIENPQIDANAFQQLSEESLKYREQRRVDLETFIKMAEDKDTVVLDARSQRMYNLKHVKGAVNLNFSEFSVESLADVIPSKETRVLIYCNNNFKFDTNSPAFFTKAVPLSLNVPTFINLYGYGYKNIYELGPVIDEKDTVLKFEGSEV